MYKVKFLSIILNKYIVKEFDNYDEAKNFAIKQNGIIQV